MSDATRDLEQLRDYLVGRLSDDERLLLQDRLARDPMLVGELEQSLKLREGLRQLRAQGYFAGPAAPARVSRTTGIRRWLPAAAAAVIAAMCLGLWWQLSRVQGSVLTALPAARTGAGVAPPVVAHFTFVSMRGATHPSLTLPPSGLIELRAAPETLTATSYRITLVRDQGQSHQRLGTVTGAAIGTDGYVHCFADSSLLKPGSYVLRIEPEGAGRGAQIFPFTLKTPAP